REAVTTYGHNFGELAINEIQFSTVQPKAAAVVTAIQNDISQTKELYRCQIDFYAARTFFCCRVRFVFLLGTRLDPAVNFGRKLSQVPLLESKTAAALTGVIGQLSLFRGHIVIEHFNLTVQALHARNLSCFRFVRIE